MKYLLLEFKLLINNFSKSSHEKSVESTHAFSNNEVTLKLSWIKHQEKLNIACLHRIDADRLLFNFRLNSGIKTNAQP